MSGEKKKINKKLTEEDIKELTERLYTTHTKSSSADPYANAAVAQDKISKKVNDSKEVENITNRLYSSHTKSSSISSGDNNTPVQDSISRTGVTSNDLTNIIDRLHTTHTQSSSGAVGHQRPRDTISKPFESEEDTKQIVDRLHKTHTKSSSGGELCKIYEPKTPQNYGTKAYPVIEGLDTRFREKTAPKDKVKDIINKMHTSHTVCSELHTSKKNASILLYPERTILMNNVDRIVRFQDTGAIDRQGMLGRTEKWYF
ncbi:DgyrCDS7728 [Dimorphilus gyrociliatus]|uniref:DgyrCDS7728 n=1 Tax=Dimorphilus gyrociliatus TaxID=2664684 RepID=A0A7I8VWW4_9ANNE|nr:DgyrCDS7728 [Dimorphilus gyrociliatus]